MTGVKMNIHAAPVGKEMTLIQGADTLCRMQRNSVVPCTASLCIECLDITRRGHSS